MKLIAHWMPALFCAFLSIMALTSQIGGTDNGSWKPAYYCFLPMCFFFMGNLTWQMSREIKDLRQQVVALKQKWDPASLLAGNGRCGNSDFSFLQRNESSFVSIM